MTQEFQRITFELAKLQQDIFRHQIPSLLIRFNEQQDLTLFMQSFIQGIMVIEKRQFINSIAENIVSVKQENNRLKLQNEQLKKLVRDQQFQVAKVEETIKDLTHQKNCLYTELQDLRGRQMSLAQLMNSSCIQGKIKQIMKQNQMLKHSLQQNYRLIQIKSNQIKSYIQKQVYWNSQVRALENDNTLFHQDLMVCNNQITRLKHQNAKLIENQIKLKSGYDLIDKQLSNLKYQINQKNGLLNNNKQNFTKQIQELQIKLQQSYKNIETKQKQLQKMKNIEQQNKYLLGSLENLTSQITNFREKQSQYQAKCKQRQQNILILNNRIVNIEDSNLEIIQKLKIMAQQTQKTLMCQIRVLQQQIKKSKQNQEKLKRQLQLSKQSVQQQKQKMSKKSKAEMGELQKQYEDLMDKVRQQSKIAIEQYENRIKQKQQQLIKSNHELQIQKEHHQYYQSFLDQNNQLKAELSRLTNKVYEQTTQKSGSKKSAFQLMQVVQIIQKIKKQNMVLRSLVHTMLQSNRRWLMKQINKLACNLYQKKSECEVCHHWEKYETNKKSISDHKTRHVGQIKSTKDLKVLNEKFKLIKQQNQKFGNRIQQIIHN